MVEGSLATIIHMHNTGKRRFPFCIEVCTCAHTHTEKLLTYHCYGGNPQEVMSAP